MRKKSAIILLSLVLLVGFVYAENAPEIPVPAKGPVAEKTTEKEPAEAVGEVKGTPVVFSGEELFRIHSSFGPFTPELRAEAIITRLTKIKDEKTFDSDNLRMVVSEFTTDIVYDKSIIMSITDS